MSKFRECIDGGYKITQYSTNNYYEINITNLYSRLHNEAGAAVTFYNNNGAIISSSYALHGKKMTEQQWEEQVKTKLYW